MKKKKSVAKRILDTIKVLNRAEIISIKDSQIVDTIEQAYFPPVVSLDPVINAHEITIEEGERAYRALRQTFTNMKEGTLINSFLEESLKYSKRSFLYFLTFFRELERILVLNDSEAEPFKIPFKIYTQEIKKTAERALPLQPPLYLEEIGDKYRVKYKAYGTKNYNNTSPLMLYRLESLTRFPDLEEYRDGFPSWFAIPYSSATIFEKYSPQLNKRVRIDWKNGQFYYFIAGSSDNWQQVHDVPIEMDDIVAVLMFRH